jgi:hypothetical protein
MHLPRLLPLALALLCVPSNIGCKKATSTESAPSDDSDEKKKGGKAKGEKGAKGDDDGDDDGDSKSAAQDKADAKMSTKLNGYITECLNTFSKSVRDSEGRYYEWCDPKKGPTGKEAHIRGLYEVSLDPERCGKAVADAKKLKPHDEALEKSADAYVDALKVIAPLTKTAYNYYDKQNYNDDKFAKGKELHPKLVAGFAAFADADRALSRAVDDVQDGLNKRDLARLEKTEGKKGRWHSKNVVLLAKPLLREGVRETAKIELPKLTAAIDPFTKAVDEFDAWSTANKDDASKVSWVLSGAKDVQTAATFLMRRVRDKTKYTASEKDMLGTSAGWMVKGSPDDLLTKYNKLIDSYNSSLR